MTSWRPSLCSWTRSKKLHANGWSLTCRKHATPLSSTRIVDTNSKPNTRSTSWCSTNPTNKTSNAFKPNPKTWKPASDYPNAMQRRKWLQKSPTPMYGVWTTGIGESDDTSPQSSLRAMAPLPSSPQKRRHLCTNPGLPLNPSKKTQDIPVTSIPPTRTQETWNVFPGLKSPTSSNLAPISQPLVNPE